MIVEAPDDILGLVRWNVASRNFMGRGVWDEYGRRVDGFRSCADGSPQLDGGLAVDGSRSIYFGPLLATRTETRFTRVASTGGMAGTSL